MSRRLAALAGLVLGSVLLPAIAQAQAPKAAPTAKVEPAKPEPSPSHIALAREAMLNSGIARSFDSIIPTFSEQIKRNSVTRPELASDLDAALKTLEPEMTLQKNRMVDTASTMAKLG